MSTMWVQPTGGALGADIHGVDLSQPMSEATFRKIAEAWGEHLVLRFSGQKLEDAQLMAFSARFGELDRVPVSAANHDRKDSGISAEAIDWVAAPCGLAHVGHGRQHGLLERPMLLILGALSDPRSKCFFLLSR